MPAVDKNTISLLRDFIQKGDEEQAKQLADELLENRPDDRYSYVTMAYYYHSVKQTDETLHWLEKAIEQNPEDESIFEIFVGLYDDVDDRDKLAGVVATGRKLYPNNALFHAQHAELQRDESPQQAKKSLEEALRLEPENDYYIGAYALLLYQMEETEKAERYERLSLHYNPNNSWMLLQFAWVAYQLKNFKKAKELIDEAIRIDPHNEDVQDMYQTIVPSTNGFIRTTLEVSYVIGKCIAYPATFIWKASNEQVAHRTLFIVVFILELLVLHVLLGKYLYILLGVYIAMMYIGSKVKKSVLKKVVFEDVDPANNHPRFKDHVLAMQEVEDQFIVVAGIQVERTQLHEVTHQENDWLEKEWPKEYNRWARYATVAVFMGALVLRFM